MKNKIIYFLELAFGKLCDSPSWVKVALFVAFLALCQLVGNDRVRDGRYIAEFAEIFTAYLLCGIIIVVAIGGGFAAFYLFIGALSKLPLVEQLFNKLPSFLQWIIIAVFVLLGFAIVGAGIGLLFHKIPGVGWRINQMMTTIEN